MLRRKFWPLGEFIKLLVWWKYIKDSDTFIIITGVEGSGKSSLAIMLADYIDSTFRCDMEGRLAFTIRDMPKYVAFHDNRASTIERGQLIIPQVFLIDEGQNFLFSRNAMSKVQKEAVETIRTQRFTKSITIICLPNITEIERAVLSRADVILVCDYMSDDVYGVVRQFGEYLGSIDYFLEKIMAYKQKTKLTPPMLPSTLEEICGNRIWDIIGTKKYDKRLYEVYYKFKVKYSKIGHIDDNESDGVENTIVSENTNKSMFTPPHWNVVETGGNGRCFDDVTEPLYLDAYYSYDVLASITGLEMSTLRNKCMKCRKQKKGRKAYILLADFLQILRSKR